METTEMGTTCNMQFRNAYRVLVGKPESKRPLGRPRRRWEDTLLIVFPTPSLHIEMVKYCTPIIIERAKLHMSILVLKYVTKLINLLSKGTIVRSAELL